MSVFLQSLINFKIFMNRCVYVLCVCAHRCIGHSKCVQLVLLHPSVISGNRTHVIWTCKASACPNESSHWIPGVCCCCLVCWFLTGFLIARPGGCSPKICQCVSTSPAWDYTCIPWHQAFRARPHAAQGGLELCNQSRHEPAILQPHPQVLGFQACTIVPGRRHTF